MRGLIRNYVATAQTMSYFCLNTANHYFSTVMLDDNHIRVLVNRRPLTFERGIGLDERFEGSNQFIGVF